LKYFFDTYAVIEFLKGNKNYIKYFEKGGFITKLNIMELYFYLLREFGKNEAEKIYATFASYVMEYGEDTMKEAMEFKLKMKKQKKDVSYTDAIGYVLAKKNRIKFLTGDEEFRGMDNVEFVK